MQKGFIFPSLYIYLGFGLIVLTLGIAVKVQSSRLESCKFSHQTYISTVAEMGRLAEIKAKQVEAQDKLRKAKVDEDLRKLRIANDDLSKRVRDNAGSSFVSRESTPPGIPETACFNSETLDGAIRNFATGVSGIIEQGQSAVTELNNAKSWAVQGKASNE